MIIGFRNGAYATVWPHRDKDGRERVVNPVSDRLTTARISISVKDRQTGEYRTEFSNFVKFAGTAAAQKARTLKAKDRIQLIRVDYYQSPGRNEGEYYDNWMVYEFEIQNDRNGPSTQSNPAPQRSSFEVNGDEFDPDDDRLPF